MAWRSPPEPSCPAEIDNTHFTLVGAPFCARSPEPLILAPLLSNRRYPAAGELPGRWVGREERWALLLKFRREREKQMRRSREGWKDTEVEVDAYVMNPASLLVPGAARSVSAASRCSFPRSLFGLCSPALLLNSGTASGPWPLYLPSYGSSVPPRLPSQHHPTLPFCPLLTFRPLSPLCCLQD